MKINEIKIKLPSEKKAIENFFFNCEKRRKFITSDKKDSEKHLKKAKHDLYRAIKEQEDKCWDWTVIKAYYSIHHAANSLLLKKIGYFCKDHLCLIIALKYFDLIPNELFKELSSVHESLADVLGLDLTFQLRKISQYSIEEWERITEKDASLMVSIAKKIISFAENA